MQLNQIILIMNLTLYNMQKIIINLSKKQNSKAINQEYIDIYGDVFNKYNIKIINLYESELPVHSKSYEDELIYK